MTGIEYAYKRWVLATIENCVTLAAITLCVVFVAYFAQSAHGLWSLLLMFNLNASRSKSDESESDEAIEEKAEPSRSAA
jgi:hypothetical protein